MTFWPKRLRNDEFQQQQTPCKHRHQWLERMSWGQRYEEASSMRGPEHPETCVRPVSIQNSEWRKRLARFRGSALSGRFISPITMVIALILPSLASAHVKWFAPFDISKSPVSVGNVITPHFLAALAGFTLLVFGGFLCDRLIASKYPGGVWFKVAESTEEALMRAGIGGFFMALFATGGVILTPELRTPAEWPAWLQLGIAISLLSTRTCFLGGAGILVLYGYGAALYGAFHISDYPVFLGIAAYLMLTSCPFDRVISFRIPILYISLCISLMWGAVEKWAYPEWTFPLLAERPYLTFGVGYNDFMVIAGFVEFAMAFYILTGLAMVRLAIVGLLLIFSAAIVDFGKLDAIGHLPIIVSLVTMMLHGPTDLHRWFHDASDGIVESARKASVTFATSIFLLFSAYYGLQYTEYGPAAQQGPLAAMAAPSNSR